ncbi:septum site-determining protein MinC [Bacillaceae bacterium]
MTNVLGDGVIFGMTVAKHKVTIKGTKDGLLFQMDDSCSFDELIAELQDKMENSHQRFLSGPLIRVTIKTGSRYLTPEQEKILRDTIGARGNLLIKEIESDVIRKDEVLREQYASRIKVETRTVRSGQVLEHQGDLLLLGDVNPGGCVRCTGNIFVMGSLRGLAHAGMQGDEEAIIAASVMRPTQLRIAGVISRPSEEWIEGKEETEFAYLDTGKMAIAKINQLCRLRPTIGKRWNILSKHNRKP